MNGRSERVGAILKRTWPLLGPCVLLCAVWLVVQSGDVVLQREATLALIYVVVVVGFYSFAGLSGILSFGHMSFMSIGAYVTALITIPVALKSSLLPDLPSWLADAAWAPVPAALLAGAVAAVFGVILAIPLMRLTGIAASLSMFAVLLVVHDVASNWEAVTRGRQTMIGVPTNVDLTFALFAALIACVAVYAFQQSRYGLRLRASRDDEIVAQASGVDVVAVRRLGFVLSAFFVGVGGFLYAQFLGSFTPESFFVSLTFLTIAMLVVGGQHSLGGAVVGALAMSALNSALLRIEGGTHIGPLFLSVEPGFSEVALAAALLGILLLRPEGLMRGREFRWPPALAVHAAGLAGGIARRRRGAQPPAKTTGPHARGGNTLTETAAEPRSRGPSVKR